MNEADLAAYTRKAARASRLAQRASRKRKGLLDRLALWIVARMTKPKSPQADFMRDEIVDSGVGFSVEELAAYRSRAAPTTDDKAV